MKKLIIKLLIIFLLISSCSSYKNTFNEENLNLRTTFEETIGTTEYPKLNENLKIWLVALPAIIMSKNNSNLDTLEVMEISDDSTAVWKTVLSRDWGIQNREDLLERISHMEYSGHNDTFLSLRKLIQEYDNLPVEDIVKVEPLSEKQKNYYSFMRNNSDEYGKIDLVAWDLGRMTSLIRWGYQVGFLTENESWNMLLYFGNKIQQYYNSWEEYGEAYRLGRIFWASGFGEEDKYRESTNPIVEELLAENGFWNKLKWKVSLPEATVKIASHDEILTLEMQAIEIDGLYNVSAREYTTVYFNLGNHYMRMNNLDRSYDFYKKGLRLDSRDWETQVRTAKIEYVRGDYSLVSSRLNHILRNCNDEIILSLSRDIKEQMPPVEELQIPENYDKVLLIHPYEYIPDYILNALKSRISEEFKIRVSTGFEELGLNETDFRSPQIMLDRYIFGIVDDFTENRKDEYNEILKELGFDSSEDLSLGEKYIFVEYLYNQSEKGKELWPDLIKRMNPQYNARVLREDLKRAYGDELKKPNVVGVLGVTLKDIYAEDYNFLFGWNGPGSAVMSIHRFYTEETPLTRTIKRSVNQSLSSTGFILGIPRCTVSNCARAYPHSLEEQDSKEDILCNECREALMELYNQ
ncbi:MAG: DUF1266 domain-containing protein [Spirochaetaceae bacterium]|nr:DUF1266 domain-containing protein [Spirochaetaceae bacterium]